MPANVRGIIKSGQNLGMVKIMNGIKREYVYAAAVREKKKAEMLAKTA